jgi:AraC family transcriptional regulator, regulatory protein of adaptative response / DNA-3-methyladenine glycosylase II
VREVPGRRVPGHVDGDELAARAVLGQQVSLRAAATLAGRLVAAYGTPLGRPIGGVTHLFPTAAELAQADPRRLSLPLTRGRALLGLARALAGGELELDAGVERDHARRRLLGLPGIGPWTVEYIAMRALRDPDAFLPTDVGLRRALALLGRDGSPRAAIALAEAWWPYRAYAIQHLWAHQSPQSAPASGVVRAVSSSRIRQPSRKLARAAGDSLSSVRPKGSSRSRSHAPASAL